MPFPKTVSESMSIPISRRLLTIKRSVGQRRQVVLYMRYLVVEIAGLAIRDAFTYRVSNYYVCTHSRRFAVSRDAKRHTPWNDPSGMPLMIDVESVDSIRRTKAIKKKVVSGVAGRSIVIMVVVSSEKQKRPGDVFASALAD